MLFNSYIFVLLFLPICIMGYFLLNHYKQYRLGQVFLLGMSLWFYGYNSVKYLIVLLCSVLINYAVYLALRKLKSKTELASSDDILCVKNKRNGIRKGFMITGVSINVGILLYFKYMDFFIDNINSIFRTDWAFLRIALPLGISFVTFQQISFIVDAYRGDVPEYGFLDYACFVTFFPQLIAGPIVTHDELVPQFMDMSKKKFNADNMVQGIYIFTLGLAKKVLLADTFGKVVDYGYLAPDTLNSATAIITILSYTIQIYFDFSGYCDMAIGIGKMLNIDLPLNFNSPYKACTITEFWDRWHMTLTRFFTKYVYIPLGGSRRGTVRTYVNVFFVFLISGFWHGASWNFVLWGILHGYIASGPQELSFDNYVNWSDYEVYGEEAILAKYGWESMEVVEIQETITQEDYAKMDTNIEQNIVRLAKENPDIEFYLYFTPYSIYCFDWWNRQGLLEKHLLAEKYFIEKLLPYENIHVFSFLTEYEVICNPNNYKDMAHHSGAVNSMILQRMYEGYNEMTYDNYEEHCQQVWDFYTKYDYDGLYE